MDVYTHKEFVFNCSNGITSIELSNFNCNETTKNFITNNPGLSYDTTDSVEMVNVIRNILRGYRSQMSNELLANSKIACILGITDGVIINIDSKIYILDRNYLVSNFSYFEKFMENYQKHHPDYSEIKIDRSSFIFDKILDHLNGNFLNQHVILNHYEDIKSDCDFYGYMNKERKMIYYPSIDLDKISPRAPVLIININTLMYHKYQITKVDYSDGDYNSICSKTHEIYPCIVELYVNSNNAFFSQHNMNPPSGDMDKPIDKTDESYINRHGGIVFMYQYSDSRYATNNFFRKYIHNIKKVLKIEMPVTNAYDNGFYLLDLYRMVNKSIEKNQYIKYKKSEKIVFSSNENIYCQDVYGFVSNNPILSCTAYYDNQVIFYKELHDAKYEDLYYLYFSSCFNENARHCAFAFPNIKNIYYELHFDIEKIKTKRIGILPINPNEKITNNSVGIE